MTHERNSATCKTPRAIGQQLLVVPAASGHDFEAAFASILQHRARELCSGAGDCMYQAFGIVGDAAASASYWTINVGEIRFQI
jgi:hypothetical protein